MKRYLPWWFRIGAKLVLARLPVPYQWWRMLDVFRHGDMHDPSHACSVFEAHFKRAVAKKALPKQFTCLELGPGDSLLSGLVARAFGASRVYMVDAGNYAVRDIAPYHRLAVLLRSRGMPVPEAENATQFDELLTRCGIVYLTKGVNSLRDIPSGVVDYVWSQVVLEHVPKMQFRELLYELRRVMSERAVGSHSIDLRDHLGGALNNLRFTERVWESNFFRRSGFYTNRIRFSEMVEIIKQAGFDVDIVRIHRWESLPTPREVLAEPFASLDDDELRVAEFEIVMRPCSVTAVGTMSMT